MRMREAIARPEPEVEGYRPGVCNIGRKEVVKRQWFALLGAAATFAWILVTALVDAPPAARALAGLPAAGSFLSWYEARRRFCVTYATLGFYRLGPDNAYRRVTDRSARAADLRSVIVPLLASVAVGLFVAALSLLLP